LSSGTHNRHFQRVRRLLWGGSLVCAAFFAAPAFAEDAPETSDTSWDFDPSIQIADGPFSMRLTGLVMADFGHISDKQKKQKLNDFEIRKFALALEGTAGRDFNYKIEGALVDDDVELEDAYLQYTGLGPVRLTVGHMKTPNGLENFSDLRNLTLVETNNFSDAFGFDRRLGASVTWLDDLVRADLGIYDVGPTVKTGIDSKTGYAVAARFATFPKVSDDLQLHFGASILYRDYGGPATTNTVRYQVRPLAHLSRLFYNDTLNLNVASDLYFGVEVAAFWGPFFWESEYGWLKLNDLQGKATPRATYEGGYLGLGWFLTGEKRGYDKSLLTRTKVLRPVFEGGWGAVALTVRLDYEELVGDATQQYGGEQLMYIAGINWYLNDHMVIKANYGRAAVRDALDLRDPVTGASPVVSPLAKNNISTFTLRLQIY